MAHRTDTMLSFASKSASNPREKNTYSRYARMYVKTMVYLYQLYAYAGHSTFADSSSDFPLFAPLSSLPPFIDTTYLRIFVALNHYMVYRYCSSTTGAPKGPPWNTTKNGAKEKKDREKEGQRRKKERHE